MDVKRGRVDGFSRRREVCGGKPLMELTSSSLFTVVMNLPRKSIQSNKHNEIVSCRRRRRLPDISRNRLEVFFLSVSLHQLTLKFAARTTPFEEIKQSERERVLLTLDRRASEREKPLFIPVNWTRKDSCAHVIRKSLVMWQRERRSNSSVMMITHACNRLLMGRRPPKRCACVDVIDEKNNVRLSSIKRTRTNGESLDTRRRNGKEENRSTTTTTTFECSLLSNCSDY